MQSSTVQTFVIGKITGKLSQRTNARISIGKVDITFFNRVILKDVLIAESDNDTIFFTELVSARIDTLRFKERKLTLSELSFFKNQISVSRDTSNQFNFSFILESLRSDNKNTTDLVYWHINCNQFNFQKSQVRFSNQTTRSERQFFVQQMNLNVTDFSNFADSVAFRINDLTLNYNNLIQLNQLSAGVTVTKSKVEVQALNMKSNKSEINGLNMLMKADENGNMFSNEMNFELQLSKSYVNLSELSELIPVLREIDEDIELEGRIYGTLNDLKGKDLVFKTGSSTYINFDFYANGIDDLETMYLFLDLKKLETTVNDIRGFEIVNNGKKMDLHVPDAFNNSGLLSYKGNFSGFLSDFVTYGTLRSRMGILKTDLSVMPKKEGIVSYNGRLTTTGFKLGWLLKTEDVGEITFNGKVNGDYNIVSKSVTGLFKGEIARLEALKYEYKNIMLDGYFQEKTFDGMVSINDSNLQLGFQGRLNLSNEIPDFDFNLDVAKMVPAKLHFSKNLYDAELSFSMKANFTGDKIDNLKGVIAVDDGFYKNKNGIVNLNGIKLISVPQKSSMELTFYSDFFDIRIDGNYQFQDLFYSLKSNVNKFIPALNFTPPRNLKPNQFDYRIVAKNLDDLTHVFVPGVQVETPFFLYGKMDSNQSDFQLEGSIPGFQYKNLWFRNIFISNKVVDDIYVSKIKFGEIFHKSGVSFYNFSVNSEIANNLLHNKIDWFSSTDSTGYSALNSISNFSASEISLLPKVKTDFLPTSVFFNDNFWQINQFTTYIDSSDIKVSNFEMFNKNQNITVEGTISKDSTELLFMNFKNIDLEYWQNNLSGKNSLKGIASCSVILSRVYNDPIILTNAFISNLSYKNQLIGNVDYYSNWDRFNGELESNLEIVKNSRRSLQANGSYNPKLKTFSYDVKADSLPLALLETVISEPFSEFAGTTSGQVRISGTTKKIFMDGEAKVSNGSLVIDYTKTKYFIDDVVYFKSDTILFKDMNVTDIHKNRGRMNGILVHDNFTNMLYDFTLVSPKIKVMSTTLRDNELFYGDVFANCRLKVYGRGLQVALTGSLTSLPGTNVNISMEYENAIEQYDFLEFVNTSELTAQEMYFYNPPKADFTISFNIEATPDAKIQLVYNSQIGDVIKAEGEGILLFEMDKYGEISLAGDYTVVKGDYLFTLQSVVNKRFTIAPGGTIIWSGNPYNAIIDLSAIYSLKTSLSDLKYNTANYMYQRIPVECIILLTNELINPTINFKINFPDENESFKSELQQYFNTEEEINRQILSLIVLGKFYTPEYMRGQYQAQNPNMIGNTASELFSNQLSNWLSQISKNVDVGFKYRPGNSITNDELELALSTQIFNDRVILNGNIGNNVNPESKNSSQIVGDVDVRVKLTPNGKIQLKAYNHSNNDLIWETAPYTQGVGLSFKEEYNSLEELMYKIGSIFKKKQ